MGKKGFTLIEIIIVIVILGVLATLALPKVTNQLESANAQEAIQTMGTINSLANSCHDLSSDLQQCDTAAKLGINLPSATSRKFSYYSASSANLLRIGATRVGSSNGIVLCLNSSGDSSYSLLGAVDNANPYYNIINKSGKLSGNCSNTGLGVTGSFVTGN